MPAERNEQIEPDDGRRKQQRERNQRFNEAFAGKVAKREHSPEP